MGMEGRTAVRPLRNNPGLSCGFLSRLGIRLCQMAAVFTKVHHVTYVVESIQQMTEYLERNFGLTQGRTDEIGHRGDKSILYRIGPSMVDLF